MNDNLQGILMGAVRAVAIFGCIMTLAPMLVMAERRICAAIQNRIGPNRVGPMGLLQPLADVIKLLFKEDIIPDRADRTLFSLAPLLAFAPAAIALAPPPLVAITAPVAQEAEAADASPINGALRHPGGASPYGAVRAGRYKLIEYYEDMRVELYNLDVDIGEVEDLAERLPEQTARLRSMLHAWRNEVDAQMPAENPNYDPKRALSFTR